MKTYSLSILLASILLAGCAASPDTVIEKNIYVMENHAPVYVGYSTTAVVGIDAETEQDIRPDLTIPIR